MTSPLEETAACYLFGRRALGWLDIHQTIPILDSFLSSAPPLVRHKRKHLHYRGKA